MQYPAKILLKKLKFCLSSLVLLGLAGLSQAEELYDSWYWHAFASQGVVHTSDNNFYGQTDDDVSIDFRELGVLAGWQPLDNFSLVGQLLSRKAGKVDETDLQIDYAFASYTFHSDLDRELGIKIGRIRSPLGFYNETRDVAHTRPGILLPQSVYVDRLRSLFFARDGVQLFGSYQRGLSTLSWDLSYGQLLIEEDFYPEILSVDDLPGDVDVPFTPVARVLWDWDMGRIRLGLTYSEYKGNYDAAPVDLFQDAKLSFTYWIASAEYNTANWSLTSEYMTYESNLSDLLSPQLIQVSALSPQQLQQMNGLRFDTKGYGYYVQATRQFGHGWDAFARWDVQYADETRRDNPFFYTKDIALGLGWRPNSNWLLRAEWHVIDGTSALSVRENSGSDYQSHWQMVLFQLSYRI